MENKIKEVQEYFLGKIEKKEFEITKITEYEISFLIDGSYQFKFWIANGSCSFRQVGFASTFDNSIENFIDLGLSKTKLRSLYKYFSPHIKKYNKDALLKEKLREFNRLKRELKIKCEGD